MAKLKDGFYKLTAESIGSNDYVLLAGGGSKPLTDFATAGSLPTITNYYWANVPISATSKEDTAPTFGSVKINTASQVGLVMNSSNTANGIRFDINNLSKGWVGWDNINGTSLYNYSGAVYFGIKPDGTPHYKGHDLRAYVLGSAKDRAISASTDLNTLTGSAGGWWGTLDNTTYTNGPYQNFGLLSLRLNNNYWGQLSLPYSSQTLPIKYRSLTWSSSGNVWLPWQSVMMERYGSSVFGTEAAWSVLASWSTGQSTELGTDVTLYLHSSFSNRYGYLHIRVRRGEYLQARLLWSVNVDVSKIRVYYSSNYDNIQVAYLGGENYSLIAAELVADTDRSGSHSNRVTCYRSYTAPSYTSYITPTYDTLQQNLAGNASSATKLATGRYLWGNYFNGENNVNGYIMMNSGGEGIYLHSTGISYHDQNSWVATNIDCTSNGSVYLSPWGGNVGIGNTSPSYKLDVASNARVASIVMEVNDEINRYGGNLFLQHRGTIAGSQGDSRTGNIYMCANGGLVGIGTTSPGHKLQVNGRIMTSTDSVDGIIIYRSAAASGAFVRYLAANQTAKGWRVGSQGNHNFSFEYSSDAFSTTAHKLILDTTGSLSMYGDIYYVGSLATNRMIQFLNNTSDAYGNGIAIGGGGLTVIGGGESAGLITASTGASIENLVLSADEIIEFYSNCQTNLASAAKMTFDKAGNLSVPGHIHISASKALIQSQASTNNYTSAINWYKGGVSQGDYNPQIGQHNTGGDGTGSICILPYATSSSPWGGSVGLWLSKTQLLFEGKTVIHSGNIGSQSVNYATSAGNADTVDNLHASDFFRAYGTLGTGNSYDSDWGQSVVTFDPIVSGTYPEGNPNVTILNLGNNYARRKQLAFNYNNNNIYFRRKIDNSWQAWVRLALASEIPTSLPANGGNSDTVDNYHASSFAIWRGDASTDSTTSDVSSTSTADFFAKINATSGLFKSRFGAMRGSWWYVGNTQLDTGVGTLEMAGTAVLNLGSYADTNDTYKSLLFLDQGGRLWSYTANETAVKQWSRYVKTTDKIANASWADGASTVTVNDSNANSTYRMVWHSGNTLYGTGGIYCNPSTDYLYATSMNASDWFRSSGNTGWYNPTNNCHVYPNATTTYGGLMLRGEKGGYTGFILGTSTNYMNLMDNGTDKGLYQEGKLWILYYNRSSNYVGIRTSSLSDPLTVSGITRVVANSKYLRIGPQNSSHAHYETDASVSHWFNKTVQVDGNIEPYGNNEHSAGSTSYRFSNVYSYAGNFAGTVSINCAWPNIVCNNNASGAIESNIRFELGGVNKGYVGYSVNYGTFLWNSTASKYVYVADNGYFYTQSYINVGAGNEKNASNPPYVWGVNGSDNFMRTYATSSLSVNYATSAGSVAWGNVTGKPSFFSGNYNDLTNKPTIPNPTDYYWANVRISNTSSTGTSPTFASIFINTLDSTLKIYSGRITDAKSDGNICLLTCIDGLDGQTHSYATNYGARETLSLQPRGGSVYIGSNPDGNAYKFHVTGTSYLSSTLTMGGNIVAFVDGNLRGIKFGNGYLNSLSNQLLWQSSEAIRFGSSDWDWNAWAGLKYSHSSKIIYLGLADGTIFNANSAQSGGKLYLPGIADAYVGNGTYKILHSNNSSVSKSGETLTVTINGTAQSLTNTWRGITDSYSGTSTTTSLSQKGGNALYNLISDLEDTLADDFAVSGGGSTWGSSLSVTINGTTKTLTIPSNPNTDTKVTNTLATTTKFYVTGTSSASTNTGTLYFDTGVYVSTTAGLLCATELHGKIGLKGYSSSANLPLVFADSVNSSTSSSVAKLLYTDTANSVYYNPSTNTLSCPTFSGTLSGNASSATTASKLQHNGGYSTCNSSLTATVNDNYINHTYSGYINSYTYTGLVMNLTDNSPSSSGNNGSWRANITGIDLDITYKYTGGSSATATTMARSFTGIDLKATMTDNIMRPSVMSPGIKINWPTNHNSNLFYTPATYISGVTWHESGANIVSLNALSTSTTLDVTHGEFIFLQGSSAYTVTLPATKTKGMCFYMYKTTTAAVTFKPYASSTLLIFTGKNSAGTSYTYNIFAAGTNVTVNTKGSFYVVIAHDTGATGGYWSIIQLN